jgi:tetratricopeptide (TPR) repeat protein
LGQMLEELQRLEEAERAYEEALVLDPAHAPALSALTALYMRTERQAEGKALLEKLVTDPRLNDTQRIVVRAAGLELAGDRTASADVLRKAINNPPPMPDQTTPDGQLEPADILRGVLAEMLVRQQTDETLQEAEQLIRDIVQRRPEAAEAQRTLAGILLQKGGQVNRRQALEIFEKLAADSKQFGRADAIVLARLRESEADWQGATQALQAMAADRDLTPAQLRELIRGLLQQDATDEAGQRIAQLEQMLPAEPATVELKIRWLKDTGQSAEIPAEVEAFEQQLLARAGNDPQRQSQARQVIGQLYTSVEMHEQATERYRQVKEADPRNYGTLVRSLAQQGYLDEAIQLCLDAAQADNSTTPAIAMHIALLTGQPTPEQWDKAEPLFLQTLETHQEDSGFLNALATARLVQRRLDEAINLYRQLIEVESKTPRTTQKDQALAGVWNNLALALSEELQTTDQESLRDWLNETLELALSDDSQMADLALAAIDKAIDLGGQRPTFLDTKASILLRQAEYQEAVKFLEQAVEGANRNPAYQQTLPIHQLHLAVAYTRTDRHDEARKVYQDSLNNNLENSGLLTQTDQEMLKELKERFEN